MNRAVDVQSVRRYESPGLLDWCTGPPVQLLYCTAVPAGRQARVACSRSTTCRGHEDPSPRSPTRVPSKAGGFTFAEVDGQCVGNTAVRQAVVGPALGANFLLDYSVWIRS